MKKSGLSDIFAGIAAASAVAALAAVISLAPLPGNVFAAEGTRDIGSTVPDGTVYAGVSPDTHEPLYTTPADAPGIYTWSKGEDYCRALQASGHQDWHVPTKDELNILYENRNTGALKGTFNETGSDPAGWYWSSLQIYNNDTAWDQRFSDGWQLLNYKGFDSSLRCVR
jgi:hypothetical protein